MDIYIYVVFLLYLKERQHTDIWKYNNILLLSVTMMGGWLSGWRCMHALDRLNLFRGPNHQPTTSIFGCYYITICDHQYLSFLECNCHCRYTPRKFYLAIVVSLDWFDFDYTCVTFSQKWSFKHHIFNLSSFWQLSKFVASSHKCLCQSHNFYWNDFLVHLIIILYWFCLARCMLLSKWFLGTHSLDI